MVQSEHRTVGLVEESWDAAGLAAFARLLRQGLMRAVWPGLWVSLGLMLFVPTSCFLLLAFSPAAFAQGSAWLSIDSFRQALQGPTLRGLLDSLFAGAVTSVLALLVGCWLAWIIQRSTLWGKPLWGIAIWALLLTPSYLSALGWESLFESRGLLAQIGIDPGGAHDLLFGPVGIIWVLATRGVPFSYLAVAAGLQGVGREFEDAARVHGGSRVEALQVTFAILLPAMWSAIAIVFAESISDFGVASTLAAGAHFPVATYTLYLAIDSMPIRFPVASAVGWFLVASSALALLAQYGALRGRSFAALGGRTRGASTHRFGTVGQVAAQVSLILFFGLALGVPAIGAITASILKDFGAHFSVANVTLDNYTRALGSPSLLQPMILSGKMAAVTATLAVIFGAFVGQVLSRRRVGVSGRALDMFLMGAVALPSTVLAAGYIFAYNLPVLSALGISLYGTVFLLGVAYLAAALPSTSRLLVGPLAQIHGSLVDAARVHGASEPLAWLTTVLPLVASGLLWAWLLTFASTLMELPISEILYPPGQEPLAVGITKLLENYDFAGGSALSVISVIVMLIVIGMVLLSFAILVPRSWQRAKAR